MWWLPLGCLCKGVKCAESARQLERHGPGWPWSWPSPRRTRAVSNVPGWPGNPNRHDPGWPGPNPAHEGPGPDSTWVRVEAVLAPGLPKAAQGPAAPGPGIPTAIIAVGYQAQASPANSSTAIIAVGGGGGGFCKFFFTETPPMSPNSYCSRWGYLQFFLQIPERV